MRRMPQPPWPIYRLPDIESANLYKPVVIVEGEKAAEAAIRCGLLATTSAGGAKAAEKTSWAPLRDRDVIILPDHDIAGYEYAETVAALCHDAGARNIRIVRLADHIPGFPDGGDIADLLAHETWYGLRIDGTDDPRALGEIIKKWAAKTDPWTPPEAEGIPEWQPFPVDALPEPLAKFVRQASASVGADPVLVVFPLLACLGRCLGLRAAIEMKDDHTWIEYPIIWSAVGTHSGGGKSPALQLVTAPLDDIAHQYYLEYERALKHYKEATKDYETAKKKARGSDSTPPECPEEPKPKQILTKDVTREAVVQVLDETKDALLIAADELAGLLASFDAYKKTSGSDVGFWLQVWSGESYSVNRKTGDKKHVYIRHAAVSICGGIQTRILLRHLRGVFRAREPGLTVDNGLAAGFLISVPPRRWLTWDEMRGSYVNIKDIGTIMRKVLELPRQDDGQGGTKPTILRLSQEAQRISREIYDEHIRASQDEHEDQRIAALSKLRAYAFRIMLILECIQAVIDGREPKEIGIDSARRAKKIVDWLSYEAMRVYAMAEAGEEGDRLRALLDWITIYTKRVERDFITARDVQRGLRRYQGAGGAGRAATDLEELVKQRKLAKESENGQTRYRLAGRAGDTDRKSHNDDDHTDNYPPVGNTVEAEEKSVEKPVEEKTCRGVVSSVDTPLHFSHTSAPQKHVLKAGVSTDDSGDTNPRQVSAADLIEWVAARGGAVTVRDLYQFHWAYRGRKADAEHDLNCLVAMSYGYWDTSRSGKTSRGPAPKLFRLHRREGGSSEGSPPEKPVEETRRGSETRICSFGG